MKKHLAQLADIASGLTFRSSLEELPPGNLKVIQMRDLVENNTVSLDFAASIEDFLPKENQIVAVNDIIFRSRGVTNTAAIIPDHAEKAVLAAPLMRIRVTSPNLRADYLLWFINQPVTQSFLATRSKGTMLKMIGKKALEELEVDVPDLDTQARIARIYRLSLEKQKVQSKLDELHQLYMHGILAHKASGLSHQKIKGDVNVRSKH
jgi:restriction endonuclease S subunit